MPGSNAPIFVVGAPRSGTTLLTAMLGAHPRIDAGPETHFFPAVDAADLAVVLDPERWPGPATELVCGLHLRDVPVHELFERSDAQVRAWLAARPPSIPAMLESLTAAHAEASDKARWVEKTPRHLAHVVAIRELWPESRIVRVVRDPRDVALSQSRMPFQSSSVVVNLCQIARFDRASREFFERDGGSLTVRFEDLLADPPRELNRLCAFLGETFDPAMVERQGAVDALAAGHEVWKEGSQGPIDPARAGRWQSDMDPATQRFAALHLREQLLRYGYPGAHEPSRSIAIVPRGDRIAKHYGSLLLGLAAQDTVIAEPVPMTVSDLGRHDDLVFWGLAGQLGVRLPSSGEVPATALAQLTALLRDRRGRGRAAIWVRERTPEPERPGDQAERDLASALKGLARIVPEGQLPALLGVPGATRSVPPGRVR